MLECSYFKFLKGYSFVFSLLVGVYSDPDGELIFLLQGLQGGVTHVMFSPDGTKLYSGGRKVQKSIEMESLIIISSMLSLSCDHYHCQ